MNATPSQPQFLLLDRVIGWRLEASTGLTFENGEGHMELEPLPGGARRVRAHRLEETARCLSAVAVGDHSSVLILDLQACEIHRLMLDRIPAEGADLPAPTPCLEPLEPLPSIGGKGCEPRLLSEPRGVATLARGGIVVSDTGNHRLQVFSPAQFALVHVLGKTGSSGLPEAGTGPNEFRRPWAVAVDHQDRIYVADRGNRRIQMISSDGEWLGNRGEGILAGPTRLAIGPDGLLAVVDVTGQKDQSVQARLVLLDSAGRALPCDWGAAENIQEHTRAVAFSPEGTLYVGDDLGLVHVFRPTPAAGAYTRIGEGITGLDGTFVDLTWIARGQLLGIIRNNVGEEPRALWMMDPEAGFAAGGSFTTEWLDSQVERCQWHRLALKAAIPARTSVTVETRSRENDTSGEATWAKPVLCSNDDADCLIQSGPGRFLQVRVTLNSSGERSPSLRSIQIHFPRVSYLQYLPAVYQEDRESQEFLARFLSIFQAELDGVDERIDQLWQLLDPRSLGERSIRRSAAPSAVTKQRLHWLANLLALTINPDWPEGKLRDMIRNASASYRLRGTRAQLERSIEDYTSLSGVRLVEHYRLRRWTWLSVDSPAAPEKSVHTPLDGTVRLWSPHIAQQLQVQSFSQLGYFRLSGPADPRLSPLAWGAHKFSVFFPAHPYTVHETSAKVRAVVDRQKPAHTEAELCPVLPRFRIGVQATVGVDSAVGGVTPLVLSRSALLNYDSVLGCAGGERNLRRVAASPRPRVGQTTRLA